MCIRDRYRSALKVAVTQLEILDEELDVYKRQHQIRVHLAHIGHPILGDTVYGAKKPVPGLTGQCLHAVGLRFLHPRTGEPVELTCPLPEEFVRMLDKLRRGS